MTMAARKKFFLMFEYLYIYIYISKDTKIKRMNVQKRTFGFCIEGIINNVIKKIYIMHMHFFCTVQ
jgi:hypothetical protein